MLRPIKSNAPKINRVSQRNFFRIVNQYQKGVTFTLGKLTSVKEPGIRLCLPFIQTMDRVDTRWWFNELKQQDIVTLDNVSAKVDAIVQYRVIDAEKAVCKIGNVDSSVNKLAAILLRETLSRSQLNEVLRNRSQLSEQLIEKARTSSKGWGVEIISINLNDISLDSALVRSLAKNAEALRDREAKIIAADAEVLVADKFAKAAEIFSKNPTAFELRRLETLLNMSREKGNTVIVIPSDLINSIKK